MAAEITREELLLLERCPFFRGADEALLRRVLALKSDRSHVVL